MIVVVVMVTLLQRLPPLLVAAALFLFLHAAPSLPLWVCVLWVWREGGGKEE